MSAKVLHWTLRTMRFGIVMSLAMVLFAQPALAETQHEDYIMVQYGFDQGIARINPDGSGYQQLVQRPGMLGGGWSADGSLFAYQIYDGAWKLGIYDAVNHHDRGIILNGARFESWAPDGRLIYNLHTPAVPPDFQIANPDGSNAQPFSFGSGTFSVQHRYSPDGKKLAYVNIENDQDSFIAVRDLASGQVTNIGPSLATQHVAWSATGKLVYDSVTPREVGKPRNEVFIANADGSGRVNLTSHLPSNSYAPTISPDGQRVAYTTSQMISDSNFLNTIYVQTLPSGNPVALTSERLFEQQWRPGPIDRPLSVSAGDDFQTRTNTDHEMGGAINYDGNMSDLYVGWTVVSGPGIVTFADSAKPNSNVQFAKPGTYVLRLSASSGGQTYEDTVTVNVYTVYRVELKAWIPQTTIVDPMAPVSFDFPSSAVATIDNSQNLRSCLQQVASSNPISTIKITSSFEGDGHADYGLAGQTTPDYRVRSVAEFRWNGSEIVGFNQFGGFGQTTRIIKATGNGRTVTCDQHATATSDQLIPGTIGADGKSFTLTNRGENPLTPNQANSDNFGNIVNTICAVQTTVSDRLCHVLLDRIPLTPSIDGTITGTLTADDHMTFTYKTDFFPNYGLAVMKNDQLEGKTIINQASCVNTTGIRGAANLFARLNTQAGLPPNSGSTTSKDANKPCDSNARMLASTASLAIIYPIVPFEALIFPAVTYLP